MNSLTALKFSVQHDEGFISNKIEIYKQHKLTDKSQLANNNQRPVDYQPRFIRTFGIIRKQPTQIYQTRDIERTFYDDQPKGNNKFSRKNKQKDKQYLTLKGYYWQSVGFRLVFNRLKQKCNQEFSDFTSVHLNLQVLSNYQASNYSILKSALTEVFVEDPDTITFDSRFESGNLMYAFKSRQNLNEYHLVIQDDINTRGYNQWFYFSMQNLKPKISYKIKIVNFKKKDSLFSEVMKPVMFSTARYEMNGGGWTKSFSNVKYEKSYLYQNQDDRQPYYCLSFDLATDYENDCLFISSNLPYSYSKLINFLASQERKIMHSTRIQYERSIIAYSISNNAIPIISITNKGSEKQKMIIGILARQHPGQTWSSYLMQSIIRQLLSQETFIDYLRTNFIFKIIPMVNVDGVIYGNSRCDISGVDLNRQWKTPSKLLHPQIYEIKKYISRICRQFEVQLFLDLHGHSKKYNSFCYSCQIDKNNSRLLPYLIQKFDSSFHLPDCTFGISKDKENTARAFIFNAIKKDNVLTVELSFFGTNLDQRYDYYQPSHMTRFGKNIMKAIYVFESGQALDNIDRKLAVNEVKAKAKEFFQYDKKNQNDSGSESDPYGDQLEPELKNKILPLKIIEILEQQFRQKILKKKNLKKLNKSKIKNNTKYFLTSQKQKIQTSNKSIVQQEGDQIPTKKQREKNITIEFKKPINSRVSRNTNTPIHLQNLIYKQFNFQDPPKQKYSPKHIRTNTMIVRDKSYQENYKYRFHKMRKSNDIQRNQKSEGSEDQILVKRIQQTLYPIYNKIKINQNQMLRTAVLIQTDQPNETTGLAPMTGNKINTEPSNNYQSNQIFPMRLKQKRDQIITFQKFKQRNQRQRISRFWKENLEKFTVKSNFQK